MVSPSIKLAKSNQSSSVEDSHVESVASSFSTMLTKCDKKLVFVYIIVVFVLLIICKPKFILEKKTLNDDSKNISYSKLLLWELIFCIPLILHYIINY